MSTSKNTDAFLDYLAQFINWSDPTMQEMLLKARAHFELLTLKKNQFLVKEHEVCRHFCFVESGILQHTIAVLGEQKTTYLALRNSVTSSLSSFLSGKPSRKSIKAIVDCTLWIVDLKTFQNLIEHNQAFRLFYYNVIEKQICLIDDYRIDLLTLTPEERYKKLLATEPKLLQEVPLHYLASFLGISTRHMSRIRKNIF
ncbi:Crp/Fnr family transcriptional regulator [Flavobacterium aciduliphilum]|uniref:CRP-like cAMP-binding protein n=1 Tax=Flavobacterium aciduliphilum TaxID=1101402 RepID=A0A328YBN5_9FLAO|nr:Crp/Fnr family transcriptional regulator [Flavobacterium aciduliphilum]RAR71349.1 CRP-like cAMP-binding protein [Flavobacterium aciduliphilum]